MEALSANLQSSTVSLHRLLHCIITQAITLCHYTCYYTVSLHRLLHCVITQAISLCHYTGYCTVLLHRLLHCVMLLHCVITQAITLCYYPGIITLCYYTGYYTVSSSPLPPIYHLCNTPALIFFKLHSPFHHS